MRFRITRCILVLLAVPSLAAAAVVVSPASVTLKPSRATPFITVQLTFTTQANPGTGTLEITPPAPLIGSVTLQPNPVTYSWPGGSNSATTQFRLITAATSPPGTYSFNVSDETLGAGAATFTLVILEPTFDGRVAPSVANLALAAAPGVVRVTTQPEPGFDSPVLWQIQGLPAFIVTSGGGISSAPGYPEVELGLSLGAGATAGAYTGTVRGTAPTAPSVSRPLTVVVTSSSFSSSLQPGQLTLSAGGPSAALTVMTSAPGLTSGTVTYSVVNLPPGVVAGGSRTTSAPGFSPVQFVLQAGSEAVSGSFSPRVHGVLEPGSIVVETPFMLSVARSQPPTRPGPQISGVTPGRVAPGALAQRLAITGSNFEAGARVVTSAPGVHVGAVRVLGSGRIEANIDVRADVQAGAVLLDVVNPDGGRSPSPGVVAVVAEGSLASPLTVRTVAVLHPAPGAAISASDTVRPRGVLAVSGSGPLVVSWRLDGVVFDRSVVQARGGEPVPVSAGSPIPSAALGQHLLRLVIEGASEIASEPIAVLQIGDRAPGYRILRPEDGIVAQASLPPLMTWTQAAGSSGYVVEVMAEGGGVAARWPVRQARWRPAADDLLRLDPGIYSWQVRPTFPGGAVGDPTPSRRLVLLPASVQLDVRLARGADGLLEIAWSGGAVGLLYRVECVSADGEELYAALTGETSYRLPESVVEPEGSWRVIALGPDGGALGVSPQILSTDSSTGASDSGAGRFRLAAGAEVNLLAQSPGDEIVLANPSPTIGARWDNAVEVADVTLLVDSTDVTEVSELDPVSVTFDPFLPLDEGEHQVLLGIGDRVFEWTFVVARDQPMAEGAEDASAGLEDERRSWQVDFDVTTSWLDGDDLESAESESFGALTVSGEHRADHGFVQANGALSARQAIAPANLFEKQNRSWVAEAGRESRGSSPGLAVGYTAPDFLVGTDLLTAGLPQGGAQASLGAGPVRVSYYRAFDPDFEGVVSGISGAEQEFSATAIELTGKDSGFNLRLIGMEVDEKPDAFFGGGEGSLYGLFGSWQFGEGSSLTVELARGDFTPSPASLEPGGEGDAARLALSTGMGAWRLDLGFRYVDPEFVNPASRGLALGGIPDRRGLDLRLGRSWQQGSLDLGARRFESGSASGAAEASLSGADLSLFQKLGERVSLTLALGYGLTESDENAALALPAVDQVDWNAALNLSENFGSFTLTQDLSLYQSEDDLDPTIFSESAQTGLSLQRSGELFALYARLSAIRSSIGDSLATTDSLLAVLQPTWNWRDTGLSLLPYASYSRFEDDFSPAATTTESYRLTVSWGPGRIAWLSALQLSREWSRTDGPFALGTDFAARYSASLSVGWGSGRAAAASGFGDSFASAGTPIPSSPSLSL